MQDEMLAADQQGANAPYHYTACGLDNVWLLNGFSREESPYGETVAVEDADGLFRALAHALVTDKRALGPQELRFLRKLMHLSQLNVAHLLGCSDQTVARWEKGQTAVDPSAERLIRLVVLDWLGADPEVTAALRDLAEQDEALHSKRVLHHDAAGWKRAA